jgi:hypothetical protein
LTIRRVSACALAALAALPVAGCQSTQSKSAELEAEGSTTLFKEKGLEVADVSSAVKVVGTAVQSDQNGAAVVVTVRNSSDRDLKDVPIAIDVLDKEGKSVFKNDLPGLEQALVAIPYIPAGQTLDWVNDQVLATGTPASVKVKVGQTQQTVDSSIPDLEVSDPTLRVDPVSGTEATGQVVNRSGEDQRNLLLYAVARKGGKVVAAGRGIIARLKPTTKPVNYHIFFIGNPSRAQVAVTSFPTIN